MLALHPIQEGPNTDLSWLLYALLGLLALVIVLGALVSRDKTSLTSRSPQKPSKRKLPVEPGKSSIRRKPK